MEPVKLNQPQRILDEPIKVLIYNTPYKLDNNGKAVMVRDGVENLIQEEEISTPESIQNLLKTIHDYNQLKLSEAIKTQCVEQFYLKTIKNKL